MISDKEFLQWIHDRLCFVHNENVNYDYMHKLRAIIESTNEKKFTPNVKVNHGTTSNV